MPVCPLSDKIQILSSDHLTVCLLICCLQSPPECKLLEGREFCEILPFQCHMLSVAQAMHTEFTPWYCVCGVSE